MAANYRKRNIQHRSSNKSGQLLLLFVVFAAGYMAASLYDLTSLSAWVSTHVLANSSIQAVTKPGIQQAQLPKPKFEFYTLLANEQVAGVTPSATPTQAAIMPPPPPEIVAAPKLAIAAPVKVLPLHAPLARTPVDSAPIVSANKLPGLLASNKDAYMVQVGSFKSMHEAERMKAELVMKGFDVKITLLGQQRTGWYRVIIGPFSTKTQAQEAQLGFARREHIMGMVRKMDV